MARTSGSILSRSSRQVLTGSDDDPGKNSFGSNGFEAEDAGVLDVLRQREEPRLDHYRAQAAARLLLAEPQVLGDRGAKGAPADDDEVEWSPALSTPGLRLSVVIAEIAPLDVFGE